MNKVVLSIGSNSDDCVLRMDECLEWLGGVLGAMNRSEAYQTPAINGKDKDYINAVVVGEYNDSYESLHKALKQYEKDCGRNELSKLNGCIPIDLDIVIWNGVLLREKDFEQTYFKKGWDMLTAVHAEYGIKIN